MGRAIEIVAKRESCFEGMDTLLDENGGVYLARRGEWGTDGLYKGTQEPVRLVSDNHTVFEFLGGRGTACSREQCIEYGLHTEDDYEEWSRVMNEETDGLVYMPCSGYRFETVHLFVPTPAKRATA